MSYDNILSITKHFYPEIKLPCLVSLNNSVIQGALKANYKLISPDIAEEVEYKFNSRGWIMTITGRRIFYIETSAYSTLLIESYSDIEKLLFEVMPCRSQSYMYCLCEVSEVDKVSKKIEEILNKCKWKKPHGIKPEVTYETKNS